MATEYRGVRKVFGPFELDVEAGELRKHGVRLRISGQPLQILQVLLEKPGQMVTREELRVQVWADGTLVDFEHGLNAAMNKLRRALADSAENPRYIETLSGRGYRFIGTLSGDSDALSSNNQRSRIEARPASSSLRLQFWVGAAVGLVLAFVLGWWVRGFPNERPPWKMRELTVDPGLSGTPAISPDGKLLAYSLVRGLDGKRDLYIRQTAGGQSIRLTFDGLGNTTPDFSPDGSRIVFSSNRGSGGIYEIPAFGGEARPLAPRGMNPKFSPDGSQVAYWVGTPSVADAVPGAGEVWIVPASGGQPRRASSRFTSARYPIWAPDGKRLLMTAYDSVKAFENSSIDWWLVNANGDDAVKTGAYDLMIRSGFGVYAAASSPESTSLVFSGSASVSIPKPSCWSVADGTIIFSAESGDTVNLWQASISSSGRVTGVARRLTTDSATDWDASCAASAIAFTSTHVIRDIWLTPFDVDRGVPTGLLSRLGEGPVNRSMPSLSKNGGVLAFADHFGLSNIWTRELDGGKESILARSSIVQRYPVSSPSGARIAFSVYERDKRLVYVSTPGASPEKLCEGCLRATDWSLDEKKLLIFGGNPYEISLLDVESHSQKVLVKHRKFYVLYGRFSPDNRWISFTARVQSDRGRIFVARSDSSAPVPESAWIPIADVAPDDYANWSPDGNTLYFTSGRDGYNCLWAVRIDSESRRPIGDPFAVQHFHGLLTFGHAGWSIGSGRIAFSLRETSGNIWMMAR